jgi:transposase
VIFQDEKKFNLDGPDGYNSYWRDLRKEPMYFSKRNFGGGSVMCWAAFSARGKIPFAFVSHRMDSREYIQVLKNYLAPFLQDNDDLTFQQDNAAVHTSNATMGYLGYYHPDVKILDWPARSPDLNPMENMWAIIVRRVYANNRQYGTVNELKDAILEAWTGISDEIIQNLIRSMPTRIFGVIRRNGKVIDY